MNYYCGGNDGDSSSNSDSFPEIHNVPGLVFCDDSSGDGHSINRFLPYRYLLWRLTEENLLRRQHPLPLFPTDHRTFIGSHKGWLVEYSYSSELGTELRLINPVSGVELPLPPLNFPVYHDRNLKAFLHTPSSSNTTLPSYVVLLNYEVKVKAVAFYKMGDKHWRFVESRAGQHRFQDVATCKGLFYLVNDKGRLLTFDLYSTSPKITEFLTLSLMEKEHRVDKYFLAELMGELLLISVTGSQFSFFQVIKRDSRIRTNWLVPKTRTGGHKFFLGRNQSLIVSPREGTAGELDRSDMFNIYYLKQNSSEFFIAMAWDEHFNTPRELDNSITHLLNGMWFAPLPWDNKDKMFSTHGKPANNRKEAEGVCDQYLLECGRTSTSDWCIDRRRENKKKVMVTQKLINFISSFKSFSPACLLRY